MTIENVTDETGVLSVVGPSSGQVLGDAIDVSVAGGDANVTENWKFLDAKKVTKCFRRSVILSLQ